MKVLWSFSGLVPFMKEPLVWACSFLGYLGQFSKLFLQIDEHLLRETSDSGSRFSHIKKIKKRYIYIYIRIFSHGEARGHHRWKQFSWPRPEVFDACLPGRQLGGRPVSWALFGMFWEGSAKKTGGRPNEFGDGALVNHGDFDLLF